MMTTKRSK